MPSACATASVPRALLASTFGAPEVGVRLPERLLERKTTMTANEGDAMFDALLVLGYRVEIGDSGEIVATLGDEVIHGQTTATSIEWRHPSAMYRVRERAYIAQLRARVHDAQVTANRGPRLDRPDAHQAAVPPATGR